MTDSTDTDLSPQEPRAPRRARRRVVSGAIALGVLVGVVVLVANLVSGSLYFYNADEAVARRAELGTERFTLEGAPIGCTVTEGFQEDNPVVAFSITFGGETVDVVHFGDPADLFQPNVPVVLDGAWVEGDAAVDGFDGLAADGYYFASDRMRVKHDNDYKNDPEYQERLAAGEAAGREAAEACQT